VVQRAASEGQQFVTRRDTACCGHLADGTCDGAWTAQRDQQRAHVAAYFTGKSIAHGARTAGECHKCQRCPLLRLEVQ